MNTPKPFTVIPGLTPAHNEHSCRHPLHGPDSAWPEKNCYIDLWIELVHSLKLDPRALFSPCVSIDFEGDQWTFFKPSFDELRESYGIDVQELTLWRDPLDHVQEHLGAGKLVTLEADAFWLPDTLATDYHQQHSKTTIAINHIDSTRRELHYFHNADYYALEGEDFDGLFRQMQTHDPEDRQGRVVLSPYAEVIRLDRLQRHPGSVLRAMTRRRVLAQCQRRPQRNPVLAFAQRWSHDLAAMQAAGLPQYHRWAFSNLRQLGAACELSAATVAWCWPESTAATQAVQAWYDIATRTKALILKGARSVSLGRELDVEDALAPCAEAWDEAQFAMALVAQGELSHAGHWRRAGDALPGTALVAEQGDLVVET